MGTDSLPRPADQLPLAGMLLRRWSAADADALLTAVAESFDHLHPWLALAAEPPTLPPLQEFIERMVRQWEAGERFSYGIFGPAGGPVLGGCGLRSRETAGNWSISYWVHAGHTRRGIATTVAATLTGIGFSLLGSDRVEIHCDPENVASAAVPRRLGYRLDRLPGVTPAAPGKSCQHMIWIMKAAAYPGSEAQRRADGARPAI